MTFYDFHLHCLQISTRYSMYQELISFYGWVMPHCIHHMLYICLSNDGHLFHVLHLATVNRTAMSVCIQVFAWIPLFNYFQILKQLQTYRNVERWYKKHLFFLYHLKVCCCPYAPTFSNTLVNISYKQGYSPK